MKKTTANAPKSSTPTVQISRNRTRQLELVVNRLMVVCSCGVTGPMPDTDINSRCPLGMPWPCLRQCQLPLEDTVAGGFAIGDDDF